MESNMFSAFTDCPQIEKLGRIETSHLMFPSLASTYEIRAWMKKILHDIVDSQVDDIQAGIPGNEPAGYVPAIIPEFQRIVGLHKDPNWNGACVFTLWEYYQYYNDITVLESAYPVMKRYLSYLAKQRKNGVLEDYAQMGEWGELKETSIGASAFEECSSLSSVSIPSSVMRIGDNAFYWCSNLSSVNIPSSVRSIGYGAFSGCSNLGNVSIPKSVTGIGYGAFNGCKSDFTIFGKKGSYAEKFATNNDIEFIVK